MTESLKGIRAEAVTDWFVANLDVVEPPLSFRLIPGGHSNLTYRVEDAAGRRFVLRRPPLGAVLATAHDMGREHKIIAALGPTDVPVPPALGLCRDESVNDAPFYVMTFVDGPVLAGADEVRKNFDEAQRREIGLDLVDVLARLHAVDPDAVGLGDLGRKEAYVARQLRRWHKQWESSRTRELAAMDEVHQALQSNIPEQIGATVVHGDYRLGNTITNADARIAAVLDWELCTLGDPLADVGYMINHWVTPGEVGPTSRGATSSPSLASGFPARGELLERYSAATGRDVTNIHYYCAFQFWRSAAIVEGVLARYLKGVMGGEADTDAFRKQVDGLAEAALRLVHEGG